MISPKTNNGPSVGFELLSDPHPVTGVFQFSNRLQIESVARSDSKTLRRVPQFVQHVSSLIMGERLFTKSYAVFTGNQISRDAANVGDFYLYFDFVAVGDVLRSEIQQRTDKEKPSNSENRSMGGCELFAGESKGIISQADLFSGDARQDSGENGNNSSGCRSGSAAVSLAQVKEGVHRTPFSDKIVTAMLIFILLVVLVFAGTLLYSVRDI